MRAAGSQCKLLTEMVSASVDVTPAMIAAGIDVAREHTLGEPIADLVQRVFWAMLAEAQTSSAASSSQSPCEKVDRS